MNDKTAIETIRALKRNAENDMPEYDYGWDAAIDEAIKALAAPDAEKPGEDCKTDCEFYKGCLEKFTHKKPAGDGAMSAWEKLLDHFSANHWRLNENVCLNIFQSYASSYHAEQCKACSCNGCENEGQGMPICEMCQRNPNRSDYYKSLPEAPLV